MKKVYQTIISIENGNCMQAALASLLELPLNKVPHFIETGDKKGTNPNYEMQKFLKNKGYSYCVWDIKHNGKKIHSMKFTREIMKVDGGINGFFFASVHSQTFKDVGHAVVVDMKLNVVHDPNPNGLSLKLKPKDIQNIIMNGVNWHIDLEGKLIIE